MMLDQLAKEFPSRSLEELTEEFFNRLSVSLHDHYQIFSAEKERIKILHCMFINVMESFREKRIKEYVDEVYKANTLEKAKERALKKLSLLYD